MKAAPRRGRRQRRSLSNMGGRIERGGEPEQSAVLARALSAARAPVDRYTHGFHSYPARMHPDVARALIGEFSAVGGRVLDPFAGGGTVVVEALVAGRLATAVDLNPLAVRLCGVRCELRDAARRARLLQASARVVAASRRRVRDRVPARAELSRAERARYAPHVLLELAGLASEIAAVRPRADREALEVVLSSLLVKLSRQRADTDEGLADKRLRKGLVTDLFEAKCEELVERWAALVEAAPRGARPPRIVEGDARALPALLPRARFDLVLSSPPYGGTYDYHRHHARRYPWLGLDARAFEQGELGARRRLSRGAGGARRWDRELSEALSAMAAVLAPGGAVVLVLGDAEVGGRRVDARAQLERLAPRAGLSLVASASQRRADARGGPERREHVLWLARPARPG